VKAAEPYGYEMGAELDNPEPDAIVPNSFADCLFPADDIKGAVRWLEAGLATRLERLEQAKIENEREGQERSSFAPIYFSGHPPMDSGSSK